MKLTKILQKTLDSPNNLRFAEICALAEGIRDTATGRAVVYASIPD